MDRRNYYKEVLLFTALVAVECNNVGINTAYKAATLKGMSYSVFIVYSYAIAALILLPFAFFVRSSTSVLPSIKFPLISRICFVALIGCSAQIFGYKGIAYSSPTLASAIGTLHPAFTFTLAILFRTEKIVLRSLSTRAKIIGTIVSMSGALVVVLYKGPTILSTSSSTHSRLVSLQSPLDSSPSKWVIGGLLLAVQYLLYSIWNIFQTEVIKIYPAELVIGFIYNLCASILSASVCFMTETNLSAWRLRSDIALVAVIYSGVTGSALATVVHTWGLHVKGPVYIAIFKPFSIAIAALMGVIFLGDALYLGSVIGAVIISIGFYAVIWGKANEEINEDNSSIVSSNGKTPLLQRLNVEKLTPIQ